MTKKSVKPDIKDGSTFIDFDSVLEKIGSCGRYQVLLICLAYYANFVSGMNQLASVLLEGIPEHRCKVPVLDGNLTFFPNLTDEQLMRSFIPYNNETQKYESCTRYSFTANCSTVECLSVSKTPVSCDNGYIYSTDEFKTTIATEWNLVCHERGLGSVVRTIYFVGVLFSVLIGGNLSDRYGRTNVTLGCQLLAIAFGLWCAFSPDVVNYALSRFCIALIAKAGSTAAFVYAMEIVGKNSRTTVGIMIQAVFALGYITLSGFSFYVRDWRTLQLVIALASLVYPLLWIFLPPSPRWLFSKNRIEKGKEICYKMSKMNGKTLPDDIWTTAEKEKKVSVKHHYPQELFKRPFMRAVTLKVMFVWFVSSLVYYGLSLNVGSLAGSVRVNNILGGVGEILSCLIAIFTIDRFGRKRILLITFVISGLACIGATVASLFSNDKNVLGTVSTAFALVGKVSVSCSFGIIYNYTAEVYPTVLRGTGVGVGSMAARTGSICTSIFLLLNEFVPWITGATFGVLSLVAGLLTLQLPESMNIPLLTTPQEAEEFYMAHRSKGVFFDTKHDNGDLSEAML